MDSSTSISVLAISIGGWVTNYFLLKKKLDDKNNSFKEKLARLINLEAELNHQISIVSSINKLCKNHPTRENVEWIYKENLNLFKLLVI